MICLPRCRIKPTLQHKAPCVTCAGQLNQDMPTCPCPTSDGVKSRAGMTAQAPAPLPPLHPHLQPIWLLVASSCNYDTVSHRTCSLSLESTADTQSSHTNLRLTVQNPPLTNTERILCQKMLMWMKKKIVLQTNNMTVSMLVIHIGISYILKERTCKRFSCSG